MAKNRRWLHIAVLAAVAIFWSGAHTVQAQTQDLVAGRQIFDTTCGSSTCHGPHGRGGQGPNLQKLDFTAGQLRDAIAKGRPGTAMAPFSGVLTDAQINRVVRYLLSLSSEKEGQPASAIPFNGPATSPPLQKPGREVFFDSRRASHCGACHRFQDRGGPLGPDLSSLAGVPVAKIRASIEHPATGDPLYPVIEIENTAGQRMIGIERDESARLLRLFDVSSIPPVARTSLKSDLTATRPITGRVLYQHDLSSYSMAELTDLFDFLRSASPQGQTP